MNGEPAKTKSYLLNRLNGFNDALNSADFLWCFLERTSGEYKSRIPHCIFYPFGYAGGYIRPNYRHAPKDIDVLFFGTATPHRVQVVEQILNSGIKIVAGGRNWPKEFTTRIALESLLDRSKIGLNLTLASQNKNVTDPRFASCARVTDMLNRDLLIVSEDIPFDNPYKDFLINAAIEDLPSTLNALLKNFSPEQGMKYSALFRQRMASELICAPVIESTLNYLRDHDLLPKG